MLRVFISGLLLLVAAVPGAAQVIQSALVHVRNAEPREWSDFPERADKNKLILNFPSSVNTTTFALELRQIDVKALWQVLLNGVRIGSLIQDENDMRLYFDISPKLLRQQNKLEIFTEEKTPDDIRIGEIIIHAQPKSAILSESSAELEIHDKSSNQLLPAQLTITSRNHVLQPVAADQQSRLALRPGHIYTANGKIAVDLPAGKYVMYASRGFEYGVDSVLVDLKPGMKFKRTFLIAREVDTQGLISCDTHVHTATHSKHGDATDKERVITLAGEGIELPIITDHNQHVDLKAEALDAGVMPWFTLVTGNEVTTRVGHFNIFPTDPAKAVANANVSDWKALSEQFNSDRGQVIILNHGRDEHNNFTPFDQTIYLPLSAQRLDRQPVFFNAMEILNSGSQQSALTELFHDWMAMLNHGNVITPIGSSDSHDVSRFIVGQGRTYIEADDVNPGKIDVRSAIKNILDGKVNVSCGLLTRLTVEGQFGPGRLVTPRDSVDVNILVTGPSWSDVSRVTLYADGKELIQRQIKKIKHGPLRYELQLKLPAPNHDVYLVAAAEGDALKVPFWPLAKPYQPKSPQWKAKWFGTSGAVWIDGDKNGKRETAFDYAKNVVARSNDDYSVAAGLLKRYDEAVAIQVATILYLRGLDFKSFEITQAMTQANSATRQAFEKVSRDFSNQQQAMQSR